MKSNNDNNPQEVDAEATVKEQLRVEASKQMAIRHAAAVAAASIEKKLAATSSTTEAVKWTRQLTECQKCSLTSELAFLEVLSQMSNESRLHTLFLLFDMDGSGVISTGELAKCLKKMDTGKSFLETLEAAETSLHTFDRDGDGQMDVYEFADFVENLVDSLGCSFDDLSQFLALRVAFAESGSSVLDEAISALLEDTTGQESSQQTIESFNNAVVEVRMMLIFQTLEGGRGYVDFEDVVKALFHVTQHMDEIPRKALLMCTEETRSLDYPPFSSLLLNVVAAGSLNFHDVANSMTLSICKNDVTRTDLSDLFVGDELCRIALDEHKKKGTAYPNRPAEALDALQYSRLNRLFDLWDLDHDNTLSLSELVLGMRKFHETKELDQTLEEGVAAMLSFDENDDEQLDRDEFATLLANYARAANVPLHELIDFMVVTSAIKDNSAVESSALEDAYIDSFKSRAADKGKNATDKDQDSSSRSIGSIWKGLVSRNTHSS